MPNQSWRRWINQVFATASTRNKKGRSFRPHLESLEDRTVPSANAAPDLVIARTSLGIASGPTPQASGGFTPQQLRQAYGFNQITFGTIQGDGTGETIAIVDAYDDPNIASDLQVFDQTFGLAAPPSFTKVNQTGGTTMPTADAGWGLEESLDVEWAHAIAPGANILLVEANSASSADLLTAVDTARNTPGVVAVSMSWGGSEFSGQLSDDSHFQTPSGHAGVTFIASSGDAGASSGPSWPASSANVLSVGGTSLFLDSSGNWSNEVAWSGSGGGLSTQVSQPAYQQGVVTQSSTKRANPDVAYDATPGTGVAVYDTQYANANPGTGPWIEVGGTSAGAPQWAALIAIADQGRALQGLGSLDGPSQTLPTLYHLPNDFHDITSGGNGQNASNGQVYFAGSGYDLVTGLGAPKANLLVPDLVSNATIPANLSISALNLKDATTSTALSYGTPGETIKFSPTILNWGQVAAAGATIQLAAVSPGVTVVGSSTLSLGTVNPDQPVTPSSSFQIQLSGSLPDLQPVQLTFVISYGSGQQQTVKQSVNVVKLQTVTENRINFTPGEMVADPARDVVYLIDQSDLKLLAINTDTGQTIAQASLAGTPHISPPEDTNSTASGQLAVSLDGTRLYVALSDAKMIQVFSLPSLTPLATYSYSFNPVSLACGVNNMLYVSTHTAWDNLYQVNGLTGAIVNTFNKGGSNGTYYYDTLLRASPDGKHLYASETYLWTTGGPAYVYEYDISGAGQPTLIGKIPYQQVYMGDYAVDELRQELYLTNGGQTNGTYGTEITSTASHDFYTLPLAGHPYGSSLALLPGSPVVYGAAPDGTIVRYIQGTNTQAGVYSVGKTLSSPTLPDNSLKITPNGALVYIVRQFTGQQATPYLYSLGIISGGNDLTVADSNITVNENASASGNVLPGAVDPDGAVITAVAQTVTTTHGSVTIATSGAYTYTPNTGYTGNDSFSFTAVAGSDSRSGTVNVTVIAPDNLTVLSPSITVNENGSATGNVLVGAVDSEGNTITATGGTFATANGSVAIASNGAYTYTPNPNFFGSDSFSFTAQSSGGATASGTVNITINQVDYLTVVTPQSLSINENSSGTGNVLAGAVDSEGNSITATAGTFATADGSVTINANGSYTYTPNAGFFGTDSFNFTAETANASATGVVNVTVNAVNSTTLLNSAFNREGIVTDGTTFGGGLDNDGSAYSANLLGSSITFHGQTFTLGSPNTNNVVSATGQTIAQPAGNDSAFSFLAAGVNGNQPNLTFTVHYTDGTTQTFTQSVSDWFTPQSYSGESIAASTAYRDTSSGGMDNRTFDIYGYSFALDSSKTVQSITLPNDGNVELLSAVLTPASATPPAPTGLTATAGNGSVALSWNASSGATSYEIYRGTSSGGESTTPIATNVAGTSFTDSSVSNGTTYWYEVTALNGSLQSGDSNEASATPQAPQQSAGSATFVQNDADTQGFWGKAYGADGYDISQAAASLPSYAAGNISGNANYTWNGSTTDPRALLLPSSTNGIAACWYSGSSFTIDVNLTDGNTHQVAIYALDWDSYGPRQEQINVIDPGTGNILNSQTVSNFSGGQYLVYNITGHVQFQITNLVGGSNAVISGLFFGGKAVPANPTGLSATTGNGQVALSWAAASGASSFNLYRGTTSGGEILLASGISGTSYTDTGLTNGTTYYYEIAAVNYAGPSDLSNQVSATPQAPAGLPAPWANADIGSPGLAGSATYSNGTFTVNGGGGDIWNSSDQFNYVYQAVSGNETIIARVASQQNTDPWAKAGIMVRDSLNATAANAFVCTTPGNGTDFQFRTADGASAQWNGHVSAAAPEWVKLVINGGTITGYTSPDGNTWTQIGSTTLPLGGTYYVGLADTAHNNGLLSTDTFDNVSVTSQSAAVVGNGTGLTGQYYSDTNLQNLVLTRTDPTVNFTWPNDTAPVAGLPADNWSVKWTGQVQAQYSEAYTFTTVSDDGLRLYVNGQLVINDWTYHAATTDNSAPIQLVAGQMYSIEMAYFEGSGGATAQLRWSSASTPAGVIPTSQLYTAGSAQAVNLAGSFNRVGIVSDGSTFGGGFDGGGYALSANQLGGNVTWNGQTFQLGTANSNNVVSAQGQTISLPAGNFSTLSFLAAGVNGNQAGLTFTVMYTDGTTQTFTQSVSDWYTPQGYSGESTVVSTAYRNTPGGGTQNGPFNVYGYTFALNSSKTVQSITLPNNSNVEILAMSLS